MKVLLPEVIAGLTDMRIIDRPEDVRFAELRRIDHAYVVFNHDYYGALQVIRPFLAEQRIVTSGRYGGWNYSSMEDALMFGRQAATDARELLR
jgi:protoporphyrinogen oxidase